MTLAAVGSDVYALALASALIWGLTPILSKRGMVGAGSPLQATLITLSVVTGAYWVLFAVVEGPAGLVGQPFAAVSLFLVTGLVGTAAPWLLWFHSVDRMGASISNAVFGTHPLFSATLAAVVLGEHLRPTGAAGILVLVAGLVVLVFSRGGDVRGWSALDLTFPLAAAMSDAVASVIRRYGLSSTEISTVGAVTVNATAGLVALGAYAVVTGQFRPTPVSRGTVLTFVADGLLGAVALLVLFEAYSRGPVAVVDPLAATAPLFTTVFAYFLLRDVERVTPGVVAGVTFMVVGAALITLV